VKYEHFKMEGVSVVKALIQPNHYLAKIDLKDAYFSIPISYEHRKYLVFQWKNNLYIVSIVSLSIFHLLHEFLQKI